MDIYTCCAQECLGEAGILPRKDPRMCDIALSRHAMQQNKRHALLEFADWRNMQTRSTRVCNKTVYSWIRHRLLTWHLADADGLVLVEGFCA